MSRKALVHLAQTLNKAISGRQPTLVTFSYLILLSIFESVVSVSRTFSKRLNMIYEHRTLKSESIQIMYGVYTNINLEGVNRF